MEEGLGEKFKQIFRRKGKNQGSLETDLASFEPIDVFFKRLCFSLGSCRKIWKNSKRWSVLI